MKRKHEPLEKDPRSSPLSRRRFMAGCAACAAGWGGLTALGASQTTPDAKKNEKPRVRLVYSHVPSTGPIWPNIGYDFEGRKQKLTGKLKQACPEIEFLPVTVENRDQAEKILKSDEKVDGYLVYFLGLWTGAPRIFGGSGRPTLFVDDLYGGSGEFLIHYAACRRAGHKVAFVSSSRFQDVADAARCFLVLKNPGARIDDFTAACEAANEGNRKPQQPLACTLDPLQTLSPGDCLAKLKSCKILVVGRNPGDLGKAIEEVFGTRVQPVEFKELHEAFLKADREKAAQRADRWIREAQRVVEPSREEIEKSGTMYLAMNDLLDRHQAEAITINCLGGFYGGHITAYPCLGFFQLNNDGRVGACEADLISTITMVTMGHLTGRPGFISDPVIDTSKNQIIYAHCVAPNKVFGPEGMANPYHIRDHSEDRKGAAVRSLMPLGCMTTTLEFHPLRKQVILHQGKTVENIDQDMACRTKLGVEVKGDINKLMLEWDQWGWHRVTYFGDLKGPVREMGKALGMELVEEA